MNGRSQEVRRVAAIALSVALACSAASGQPAAGDSPSTRQGPTAGKPATTPAAGALAPRDLTRFLTAPGLIQVTPDDVAARFGPLVELKSDGELEGITTFSAQPSEREVRWAQAQFAKAGRGWKLTQLLLWLRPGDRDTRSFYQALTEQLRDKLGRPASSKPGPIDRRRSTWPIGKGWLLSVEEGEATDSGKQVQVLIAMPQGEAD